MSSVIYEKKDRVAHIRLNRPDKMNALGVDLVEELTQAWVAFREDQELFVAVLSAEGKGFSSGVDVESLKVKDFKVERASPLSHEVYKPVIVAVHGFVLGWGLFLALDCDVRIASEDAEFGLPETRLNIASIPALRLPYYIPRGVAYEMSFTGTRIKAPRAYEIALVNQVVPRDKLLSAADDCAEKICTNGPLAIRAQKLMYERSKTMNLHEAERIAETVFAPLRDSEDRKEAIQAFREKRKPEWKCR
jgi:enoyl-CoA hydratase/carnithine racemase